MKGNFLKRLFVMIAAAVAVFAVAVPAWAHVTVSAPGATKGGGDQEITFRVPVEKNIATVGLAVSLPLKTPIASVDVKPVPGWTHTEKTAKLATPIKTDDGDITDAVTQITWKAQSGQGLQPGEYGDFTFIAGQLPDVSKIVFGAVQTYSDGSVVRWNQVAAPGSTEEPDNPAPVLSLAAASSGASDSAAAAAKPVAVTKVEKANTTTPTVLAIIALVLAAAAVGIAVVGNARRKSAP